MSAFDEIIKDLHGERESQVVDDTHIGDSNQEENIITIGASRNFIFPASFEKVVAYVGDVNSQIITFKIPEIHEGHNLNYCSNKKVLWTNPSNGLEGNSPLIETASGSGKYKWIMPPALFTKEGNIDFSIIIYDLDENGKIAFSWNTPVCSELIVKKSSEKVSGIENMPARDEILLIDVDTKRISAPSGYNNTIAIQGDKNTSVVYFQVPRMVKGIDLLDAGTKIYVAYKNREGTQHDQIDRNSIAAYTSEYDGLSTELVLIKWEPDENVTNNVGTF